MSGTYTVKNAKMPTAYDFLAQPSPDRIRKEIINICDSYSHPWDILAELSQNAIDAINSFKNYYGERERKEHRISFVVNAQERSIEIRDSGIGIVPDSLTDLLAPHGTNKTDRPHLIGEKGVGLTYTIFCCNHYEIESLSASGYIRGEVDGGLGWRTSGGPSTPQFVQIERRDEENTPDKFFTRIKLVGVERYLPEEEDIFFQTQDVLKFILRTKTALGYTRVAFGDASAPIQIELSVSNLDGTSSSTKVENTFALPDEFIAGKSSKVVNLDDFKQRAATLDDGQKAKQLSGKAIVKHGSEARAGRTIRYYMFFAPSRDLWKEICERHGLLTRPEQGPGQRLLEGGIFVATKGMPTGLRLEPPVRGSGGYWPNFFILLEDDSLTFDLGRKSIPGRTQGLLKEIALELFNEVKPYIKYVSSDPPVVGPISAYEKAKVFEDLKKLPDLGLSNLKYLKHPDDQEAAVVAVFHELVGNGSLKGYYSLKTGYRETYDLWATYRMEQSLVPQRLKSLSRDGVFQADIVIEFKYSAESILEDVADHTKEFSEIDLIVCWDLDELRFSKEGIGVEPLAETDATFFGSNYLLTWPGAYNLGAASQKPVIALRKFVESLRVSQ